MPWRPSEPGEVPTLGWYVIDWIAENLAAPDRAEFEPFVLYPEQESFVLRFYEIDPASGKRRVRRGVYSRSRGAGKSPFVAALAIAEALADVVPDGWDAAGQPVGKPWSRVRTPLVQIAAVSETQSRNNTWQPLLEMLDGPVVDNYPGLEPLEGFVNLPRAGRIQPVTTSAYTVKGARCVFAVLDQTEGWVRSNGGLRFAETMRVNAGKVGGTTLETPNAYTPGEGSVAEESAAFWSAIVEGRARDDGLYYDHREAPADTDLQDRESLLAGLRVAYGDAAAEAGGHVDLDRIVAEVWDPNIDPQRSRADYLNQVTHAQDSWLSQPELAGCVDLGKVVADREMVTLGFDGSRQRTHASTDATALVGCRLSDGHVFEVGVWEPPPGDAGKGWQVPAGLVDGAVRAAHDRWTVVGFYADPAKWETYVAKWEAAFGGRYRVKSSREHPIEWWMLGGRTRKVVEALDRFHSAVVDRELTYDGSYALSRHILNARRRPTPSGTVIAKDHPESANKIDAAVAGVLAWEARLDAIAAGVLMAEQAQFVPRRVR